MNTKIITTNFIRSVFPVSFRKGDKLFKDDRDMCGVALTDSARIIYRQGDRSVTLDPHKAVFLVKGSSYTLECLDGGTCWCMDFESDDLGPDIFTEYIESPPELVSRLKKLVHVGLGNAAPPGDVYEMFAVFYRIMRGIARSDMPRTRHIIDKSVRYMNENFGDPSLDIASLAAVSNISPTYFRQLFAAEFGMPPMKYIRKLRIDLACRLFDDPYESGMNVSEVASLCGFSSVYRFSDYFRQVTGMSPTAYIKTIKGRE